MVNLQILSDPQMPALQQKLRLKAAPQSHPVQISPLDSVLYMGDMLENLRKIAAGQGLGMLAHLLELAQAETRIIVREHNSRT